MTQLEWHTTYPQPNFVMGKKFASKVDFRFVFSSFLHQQEEVRREMSKCQAVGEKETAVSQQR